MTGKIFRNFLLISFSAVAVSAVLFIGILYGNFVDALDADLVQQTELLGDGLEYGGLGYLEKISLPSRVTWVDEEGTVLYDNQASAAGMGNHADREEIREALETGYGSSERYSDTISERTVYAARRLADGTVIRVAQSHRTALAMLLELTVPISLILCAALILSMVMAFRLSRRLMVPVLELDLEHPENCHTYDELAPLLSRLRRQNQTIQHQMDELRRQQEEFRELTEYMSEGIVVLDRNTCVLSCNSAALNLLGAKTPGPDASALDLDDSEVFRAIIRQVLQGLGGQGRIDRNGRCVQIMADPVEREGELSGSVLVLLDVTAQEDSEKLRREFTANVSHELKTPLTSISGMAEIMKSGIVRPEDMPEFAGDIYRESKRLIALVEDIIHLSQLDEGGVLPQRTDVELKELAEQVLQRLRHQAEQANVELKLEGETFVVSGISGVLEEMLYNLCDNAVKYNRSGGSVKVSVDPAARTLTVTDTGIGIPEADQQRVFERFYRVDKSRSRQIGGTGLGLSIVKHGAALHDIRIELSSVPDEGTSVKLNFPSV